MKSNNTLNCLMQAQTLTIVIAFPPKQGDLVRANIESWSLPELHPCQSNNNYGVLVDLIFYISRFEKKIQFD